jgi:hypothetical protein
MKNQFLKFYPKGNHNLFLSFLPAFLFFITITVLSAIPGDRIELPPIWNLDKFLHMLVYFVQTLSIALGYRIYYGKDVSVNRMLSVSMLFGIIMGGILEILQEHVFQNRSGDYLDFLANSLRSGISRSDQLPFPSQHWSKGT